MYRPLGSLGYTRLGSAFGFGAPRGFGDVVSDPLLPSVTGAQFVKAVLAVGFVMWVWKKASK